MAFQRGTSPASGSYREILVRLVAFATSKHVSAVAINNDGSGYTAGDMLTISHAGGYLPCVIEVLTVDGGGNILTVKIRSAGAFSNRVASVAVNAGGTGYTTGQVVRLTTGTFTEWAKLTVTAAAGAVTSATVFETGGAYSVAPSAAGATNSDVGLGSGTGFTCTPTMTGLIGTSGIAATGGTGTGATFDLTLTDTGWTAVWNHNDYSFNSVTDEKELVLRGTVAGGDPPYVGFRTHTSVIGITTGHGWLVSGMNSHNPGLAYASQPGIGPTADPASQIGVNMLMFDDDQSYWFAVNERRLIAVVKCEGLSLTSYTSMYAGLMLPLGTQIEYPYPMYLSGSSHAHNRQPDAGSDFITGLTELRSDSATVGPHRYRNPATGGYDQVLNVHTSAGTAAAGGFATQLFPLGAPQAMSGDDIVADEGQFNLHFGGPGGVATTNGGAPTTVVMPTLGADEILRVPCVVTTTDNTNKRPRGQLDGVYWIGATKSDGNSIAAEDTLTAANGDRFIAFQNAHRSQRYSFFVLQEA